METHFDINFDEIVAAAVVPRRNGKSTKVCHARRDHTAPPTPPTMRSVVTVQMATFHRQGQPRTFM